MIDITKPPAPRKYTIYDVKEERFQADCSQWFNTYYPQYKGLLCYNNNNSVGKVRGAINKAIGTVAGRADFVLYFRNIAYHIEFKLPGKKQQPVQIEWQKTIQVSGFPYYIVESYEEFEILIESIVGLPLYKQPAIPDPDICPTCKCFVCDYCPF